MSERDFYLLVRKYFNARDVARMPYAHSNADGKTKAEAVLVEAQTETEIRKALSEFTKKDVNELPFK